MIAAAQLLKQHLSQVRTYSSTTYSVPVLRQMIERYTAGYGGDWNHGCRVLQELTEKKPFIYETSHMVAFQKQGGAGLEIVDAHFGIQLPESAHAFYREIRECVLSLSFNFVVLCPEDIIHHEEWHREIDREIGFDFPVTIVRFATFIGEPLDFAFRKSCADGQWRITLIASAEDSPELDYFEAGDGKETDQDINSWMERLLRTDGYPLRPSSTGGEKKDSVRV